MTAAQPNRPWFAVHVATRERNIQIALQYKGFEIFSPYYVRRKIGARGRERVLHLPLFPGYLFCSLDPQDKLEVLKVPGVKSILGIGQTVTPIPLEEIEAIRKAVSCGLPYEPCQILDPGDSVVVETGPLAGIKGSVFRYKGKHRLVIKVLALNNRAVSVEVEDFMVTRKGPGMEESKQGRFEHLRMATVYEAPAAAR